MKRGRNPYSQLLDDPLELEQMEHQRELAADMAVAFTVEPPPIPERRQRPRRGFG